MAVPDYQTMMLTVLTLFANGTENVSQCLPALQKSLGLSDDEAQELLPTGVETKLADRARIGPVPVWPRQGSWSRQEGIIT